MKIKSLINLRLIPKSKHIHTRNVFTKKKKIFCHSSICFILMVIGGVVVVFIIAIMSKAIPAE
jgi:hypothetical protein